MSSTRTTGTLRWQAPELLNPESDEGDGRNSMPSDVYAFACVCYEVKIYHTFRLEVINLILLRYDRCFPGSFRSTRYPGITVLSLQ
jgi:hypothetical protein